MYCFTFAVAGAIWYSNLLQPLTLTVTLLKELEDFVQGNADLFEIALLLSFLERDETTSSREQRTGWRELQALFFEDF